MTVRLAPEATERALSEPHTLTGPGRLGLQSMYLHLPSEE
jgi:hypothetical protein